MASNLPRAPAAMPSPRIWRIPLAGDESIIRVIPDGHEPIAASH